MSYATQAQVEGYLGRPLTADEVIFFPTLSGGVDDYIDNYCARTFNLDRAISHNINSAVGDKSSNPYQSCDGGDVEIFFDQPLQTDTTQSGVIAPYIGAYDVGTGNFQILDPTTYIFYPTNYPVKTSVQTVIGVFPYGVNNIFVYGTFTDYLTPPSAIQTAAATLMANFYNMTDDLQSETIEGYARVMDKEWNPFVHRILEEYKRVVL